MGRESQGETSKFAWTHHNVIKAIESASREEILDRLRRIGVIDENNQLTEAYKPRADVEEEVED